ncbi:MAG: hypothetical protein JW751_22650 [Polyangiaceae bacterium]|nr:hypothetical protein [Polyangiaceae bacterium]
MIHRHQMARFTARRGVRAWFCDVALGVVNDLDIGEYHDPDQPPLQYYVYAHGARQDVIRFASGTDLAEWVGRLAPLRLAHEGAEYRVMAVLVEQSELPDPLPEGPRFSHRFEGDQEAIHVPSARERHGIDDLGAALLLDTMKADREE